MGKKKHTIPELAGRVARLEQMAEEHVGVDLSAYDAAQEEAKQAWIEANPDHSEQTMGEPVEEPEEETKKK